jgi:hypothetical protein
VHRRGGHAAGPASRGLALWSAATAVIVFVLFNGAGWAAEHPESIGRWAGLMQRVALIAGWAWIGGITARLISIRA